MKHMRITGPVSLTEMANAAKSVAVAIGGGSDEQCTPQRCTQIVKQIERDKALSPTSKGLFLLIVSEDAGMPAGDTYMALNDDNLRAGFVNSKILSHLCASD